MVKALVARTIAVTLCAVALAATAAAPLPARARGAEATAATAAPVDEQVEHPTNETASPVDEQVAPPTKNLAPAPAPRPAWGQCAPQTDPCARPRPARWILGLTGLAGAIAGAAYLLVIGDRVGAGDPGALIGGAGSVAFVGALLGGLYGLVGGDRAGGPDRLRPATLDMSYSTGGAPVLDERHPGVAALRFAPNYYLPRGGGRIRLFGHFGGTLGREREVDPQPKYDQPIPGQVGPQPVVLDERRLQFGVGADLAVYLPYPALRRSAHLGPAELRWRPELQLRRHIIDGDRLVERMMLMPLTIGARWSLSPRQRFTFYMGPRFDTLAVSDGGPLARGGFNIASLHGEAWYDYDLPALELRRARVSSQLTIGYLHSRFDGRGLSVAGIRGFLGPAWGGLAVRVRPSGSRTAFQGGVGLWVGDGVTGVINLGVVLPDLGEKTARR